VFPLRVAWEPVVPTPQAGRGLPSICRCYGTRGRCGGLPVVAVALEDGHDVFGADDVKVQVKAAGKFTPGRGG